MAHALLLVALSEQGEDMTIAFSAWHPLVEAEVAALPDSPGVFEVATLVRTVLFIGAAPESLVATLTRQLDAPGTLHAHGGRLYFRCYATEESERDAERASAGLSRAPWRGPSARSDDSPGSRNGARSAT